MTSPKDAPHTLLFVALHPVKSGTDTRAHTASRPPEDLPYRVDLWRAEGEDAVERVLARAASMPLARDLQCGPRGASRPAHHLAQGQPRRRRFDWV